MPGTELFGAEERKEIEDVLSTGIMFRFNHDAQRNNIWKAKDFEAEAKKIRPFLKLPLTRVNVQLTTLIVAGIEIIIVIVLYKARLR